MCHRHRRRVFKICDLARSIVRAGSIDPWTNNPAQRDSRESRGRFADRSRVSLFIERGGWPATASLRVGYEIRPKSTRSLEPARCPRFGQPLYIRGDLIQFFPFPHARFIRPASSSFPTSRIAKANSLDRKSRLDANPRRDPRGTTREKDGVYPLKERRLAFVDSRYAVSRGRDSKIRCMYAEDIQLEIRTAVCRWRDRFGQINYRAANNLLCF